jgi:group I intron endonuclease
MIGIYKITNLVNGKIYYGSSKDIEKRWRIHKNNLNNNKHHNIKLLNAWNKYGEENFKFDVIEECDETILLEKEQYYLDLKPDYNIGLKSSGGDNLTKNPNKNEIVGKITDSIRKRYSLMTPEQKKEIFSLPMDKNPNWKGGVSYKYCECGVRIKPINDSCSKCRNKSGENNPFFGKQHSEETKKKLSESKKGTYYGEQNIPIMIDGIEYKSAGEASKVLNIPMVTIRWRVLSKNKKFDNYKYK